MKPGERGDHPIELLSASIDRELRPSEAAALEAHLEGCAGCRGLLVDFRRLDEALVDDPAPAVPAGLKERILSAARSRPAPRQVPFWRQAMPLAAAASIVMAVLIWYGRPDRLPPLSEAVPDSAGNQPHAAGSAVSSKPDDKPAPGLADRAHEGFLAPRDGLAKTNPSPAPGTKPAPEAVMAQVAPQDKLAKKSKDSAGTAGSWKVEPMAEPRRERSAQEEAVVEAGSLSTPAPSAPAPSDATASAAPQAMGGPAPPAERKEEEAEKQRLAANEAAGRREAEKAVEPQVAAETAKAPGMMARNAPAAAPMQAAETRPRPVGLFAAPYIVTLQDERTMRVERGAWTCSVPIDDADAKRLAAAAEEIVRASGAASDSTAVPAGGAVVVTASPQAREAILRLVRERYRPVIESRCGSLPR